MLKGDVVSQYFKISTKTWNWVARQMGTVGQAVRVCACVGGSSLLKVVDDGVRLPARPVFVRKT